MTPDPESRHEPDRVPPEALDVAVVTVHYRTPDLVVEALAALAHERARLARLRAVVVDGASDDGSAERIAAAIAGRGWGAWARLLALPVNGGFGYANNQGLFHLRDHGGVPEFLCLLNPDARPRPGALLALAACLAAHPRAGAVGASLEDDDGARKDAAFRFPTLLADFCSALRAPRLARALGVEPPVIHADRALRVPWVTGAAVMLRRDALDRIGLFDDGFFLYYEDMELLWRLGPAGWEIWHEPAARVVHRGWGSTRLKDPGSGRLTLPRYWYEARRRYFVRTRGRALALLHGLCWLAGRLLFQLRCLLTRRRDDDPRRTRAFLAWSLWPRARDRRTTPLPDLQSPAGRKPAWMEDAAR